MGMQSATSLAALGPGTVLIDYSTYVFTFLAVAGTLCCTNSAGLVLVCASADSLSRAWGSTSAQMCARSMPSNQQSTLTGSEHSLIILQSACIMPTSKPANNS